ncbi:MAG TPA: hypothetical protein DEF61_04575 [Firmicutes bacterium]|nr:hypothetical protein [Bacillota bacterium]HBX25505.1 hypothetical protein [Bacillota bacterium]
MKDCRVEKTKEAIRNETLRLLQKKSLQDVTVKEITTNLSISRSTFYLHYENISAVLDDIENMIVEDMKHFISSNMAGHYLDAVYKIGYYIKDNRVKIKTIIDVSQSHFLHKLKKTFEPMVLNSPWASLKGDEKCRKYVAVFLLSAGIGVFRSWCDAGCDVPVESLMGTFILNFGDIIYNTKK